MHACVCLDMLTAADKDSHLHLVVPSLATSLSLHSPPPHASWRFLRSDLLLSQRSGARAALPDWLVGDPAGLRGSGPSLSPQRDRLHDEAALR